jgi:hypothetical protein
MRSIHQFSCDSALVTSSMGMAVMHVRPVRMRLDHRGMLIPVRMLGCGSQTGMAGRVMCVIVAMPMGVRECRMLMRVHMALHVLVLVPTCGSWYIAFVYQKIILLYETHMCLLQRERDEERDDEAGRDEHGAPDRGWRYLLSSH